MCVCLVETSEDVRYRSSSELVQSVLNAPAQFIYVFVAPLTFLSIYTGGAFRSAFSVLSLHVLTIKVLKATAPRDLGPLVRVSDLPGRRALRSASTSRLVDRLFKLLAVEHSMSLLLGHGKICRRT